MMLTNSILIHFFLIIIMFIIKRNFTSPVIMYLSIWTVVLLAYFFATVYQFSSYRISDFTFVFVNFGSLSFTLGSLLIKENPFKSLTSYDYRWSRVFDYIIVSFLLISLIMEYFYLKSQLDSPKTLSSFLIQLRYLKNYEDLNYGIYKYIGTLSVFNLGIRFLKTNITRFDKGMLITSVLLGFLYAVLSTGRTNFFLILIMAFASIIVKNKKIKIFSLIKFFGLGVLSFVLMGVFLNKGGDVDNSISQNFNLMIDSFLGYLIGPLCSLDVFVNTSFQLEYGQNSFRFFYAIFYKIGISSTPPSELVESFVHIPYPSNVYTIYKKYILDFGYLGSLYVMSLLGLVTTYLYKSSKKTHSIIIKYAYIISVYPIIMSFFNEQIFSILSQWIQHLILITIFNYFILKHDETIETIN